MRPAGTDSTIMPRDRGVPACPCACTPSGRGPATPLQEPESPGIVRTGSGCPADRAAVWHWSTSGSENRVTEPLQERFRSRHLRERRADRCREDQDGVMVSPLQCHASRFRYRRNSQGPDITSPWRTGARVTCGTRLHQADSGGCWWSPVRNRGACSSRRRGDRLRPCLQKVWPRFATRQERPLTETVPSTGRRPTGPVS